MPTVGGVALPCLWPGCPASHEPGGTFWKKWRWTSDPASPDAAQAVLPNNILVLSDGTGDSSISDFVEEGSCQPPVLPAA